MADSALKKLLVPSAGSAADKIKKDSEYQEYATRMTEEGRPVMSRSEYDKQRRGTGK